MTLILTETSKFGVTMVADSAITITHNNTVKLPSGKNIPKYSRYGAQKIKRVPNKPIGISFWGMGSIGEIPTDIWMDDFLENRISDNDNLDTICIKLSDCVNKSMLKPNQYNVGGFHIGSVIRINTQPPLPVSYHIHRGHQGEAPGKFELHKDNPYERGLSIETYLQQLEQGILFNIINGKYEEFNHLYASIRNHIIELAKKGMYIPHPPCLISQEKLNRLIVGLMCDLYALSNKVASVARPISSLTIGLDGEVKFSSSLSDVSYV